MGEKSWKRNHGGGIMEEESWRRNHGGGIMKEEMEEESWEASGKHLGSILEAIWVPILEPFGNHLGSIWKVAS